MRKCGRRPRRASRGNLLRDKHAIEEVRREFLQCSEQRVAWARLPRRERKEASPRGAGAIGFFRRARDERRSKSRTNPRAEESRLRRPPFPWSRERQKDRGQKENRDRRRRILKPADIPGKEAASRECPSALFLLWLCRGMAAADSAAQC